MKVSKETIVRTIVLAIALGNQLLLASGKYPLDLDESTITTVVSVIFTVCSSVLAWWKNNSFTKAAIQADTVMAELKACDK